MIKIVLACFVLCWHLPLSRLLRQPSLATRPLRRRLIAARLPVTASLSHAALTGTAQFGLTWLLCHAAGAIP